MPALRVPKKDWARTAEEEATYLAMLAKCAKWAKPILAPAASPEIPPPPPAQLRWKKAGAFHCATECGRYSVSKSLVSGKAHYQAWALVPGSWFLQLVPVVFSFVDAQQLCETHLREKLGQGA